MKAVTCTNCGRPIYGPGDETNPCECEQRDHRQYRIERMLGPVAIGLLAAAVGWGLWRFALWLF